MTRLVIYGAGGFGREVLDIYQATGGAGHDAVAFVDDGDLAPGSRINGAELLGGWDALLKCDPASTQVCIGIGNPKYRARLAARLHAAGFRLATLIDPSAIVRPTAVLGAGTIVGARAFVSCNSKVGENVLLNVACLVGHDALVGPHTVVSPGVSILGGVKIGEGNDLGTGSQIFPRLELGPWAKVAMGTSVFKDVPANATVCGNPARVVQSRGEGWQND